jgi:hypothetical protein
VAQKAKKEKKRGKNKKKEEETEENEEYLVAPMPVWKRKSGDYGVDKELVADWERLKRSNGTVEVADNDTNPIIVHRYHPLLDHHNDIERINKIHQERQESDDIDRQEALEMLGHMFKHAMNHRSHLHQDVFERLRNGVFDGEKYPKPHVQYTVDGAVSKEQVFMNRFRIKDRRLLCEGIMAPAVGSMKGIWGVGDPDAGNQPEHDEWLGALAVALLRPDEVVIRMTGVEDQHKKDREKDCIYAFLIKYQEIRRVDQDFLDLMHSFSTLSRMLRKPDDEENGYAADMPAEDDVDVVSQSDKNSIAEEDVDTGAENGASGEVAPVDAQPAKKAPSRRKAAPRADRENGRPKTKSKKAPTPKKAKATPLAGLRRSGRNKRDDDNLGG